MKAVIYARYSSDSQREESIEGQLRECTAFAEKNGITVLRHYIDRAYSAKTDNRPEFQNMIKDSGKRLFDIVIVWKLDRFARNRYDSARYKATLKKNGVKVVSATEIISEGAEGIILESVLEGYAEYYSADLSEKVVRGMTDNALKCKFNGGTMPIGYVIDAEQHFRIDPLTAPFVLEAFKRYDGGETISSIMNWLNEQGLTNTRGQKMTFNSVGHILHNRRYIGEFRYRDVIVPDGIPAIVPQDLFDRVQEKLAKNKKAPARHKAEDDYLLTTKLFCGYCGAYLCGESGTSRTGKVHHYYKCVSVKKKRTECHKKPVRKEWIEDLVVGETMKMVMDDKAIEAIVSMLMDLQDRDNVNVPLYEQQIREADTAISNLLNAIQQGILTRSTKERLEELENRRDELENRLACEKLAKPKVSAEFMTFWLHRFRKLDVRQQSHRKMLIDTFINAIFLYDDKMVITFNYKEGTKTITLAELPEAISNKNGSDLNCLVAPKNRTPLRGRPVFWYLRRTRKGGDSAAAAKMRPVDAFLAVGESLSFQAHPAFFSVQHPPGGLSQGAELVRRAQQHALPVPGQGQIQREHMRQYHIPLDLVQAEVPLRIFHGPAGMVGAVERPALFLDVPVVEEIVVEQRSPDQGAGVRPQPEQCRQLQAHQRNRHAVVKDRHHAVLEKALLHVHALGMEDIPGIGFQQLLRTHISLRAFSAVFPSGSQRPPSGS